MKRSSGQLRDAGSLTIEYAIVMSAVMLGFFMLLLFGGRVIQQENDVRSAAHAGARAASLRDEIGTAEADMQAVVAQNLQESGVSCDGGGTAGFEGRTRFEPGGWVAVEVTCSARVGPLSFGPVRDYTYVAVEVIDEYRGTP